jgi:hypothetical protein
MVKGRRQLAEIRFEFFGRGYGILQARRGNEVSKGVLRWPRDSMRRFHLALAAAIVCCAAPASSQNVLDKDPCKAMPAEGPAAAKSFLAFDQFDRELRVALTRQDAMALAFLVRFPLRVNDKGSAISIDDAEALRTHFQEVFTAAVRKEILSIAPGTLDCGAEGGTEGVGYGSGVIWVNANDRGYAIWSVNRDAVPPFPKALSSAPKIKYVCQTETHRIVIDTVAGGDLRYRAWKKPRAVAGAPDLELTKGEGSFEGTHVCAVPIFTFKSGDATYRVEGGLGCWGDGEPGPPKEVTGRLVVTIGDKQPASAWCY